MAATITASDVKALRDQTGAAMMDCKKALVESDGDVDKALEALRIKGAASAAKRGDREASEGLIADYIHANGRIGVLVEINCETDFVARNDDFAAFAQDIALHIAAAAPEYVTEDEVPQEARDAEAKIFAEQAADKPDNIREKIVDGKINKWLEEIVLMKQKHVNPEKHDGKSIEEIRTAFAAKTGENVVIKRFARFQVGA
ncbi:MAG: translation elongation factor Ts [Thermoleophilaceae bacterium]|nr:translation elongation factor Ts [Thermoleophilaceae bacterium]